MQTVCDITLLGVVSMISTVEGAQLGKAGHSLWRHLLFLLTY